MPDEPKDKPKKSRRRVSTNDPDVRLAGIYGLARQNGVCCVEWTRCDKCGMVQTWTHPFLEMLPCQNTRNGCDNRIQSKSPRPVGPGEVTADHLFAMISTVANVWRQENFGEDSLKIEELPRELQGPVQARIAASVRSAIEDIMGNSHVMADTR